MSELRRRLLKDLVREVRPGFACGEVAANGIFQVRMNNVTKSGDIDLSKQRRVPRHHPGIDRNRLLPGDVLFNATNSPDLVGKTLFWSGLVEEAVYSNHFQRIRTDGDELDPEYLSRWLACQFESGIFRGLCKQWVNQATVSKESLLALRIPLPPLPEQKRIAAVLGQVDALRARCREAIALLDDLAQSIFLDMFGDPVVNSKDWPMRKLGEMGSLDRGVSKHRPRNDPALLGGDTPLIQTGDVAGSGGYITGFTSTYSDIGLEQSKLWPAGTLCITIAANIAKTGILTFDACFPDSVVGFTASPARAEYVRAWLSFLQEMLEASAPESAQKNINLAVLRNLEAPYPGEGLIRAFSERVQAIEASKGANRANLVTLDELFTSLQHRAFSGTLWDHDGEADAA
ncbi:restriction endonuclease subunit S [Streptomyces sp. NPDC049936]|uniref:restriction endonuclease subunit S n=1 Tax=Streptomyces sp. NPDC049936 TaxID=3365599 RepID=UPI00379ACFF0